MSASWPSDSFRPMCSMNCFYEPDHSGPHQKWLGAPCDHPGCTRPAVRRIGRLVACTWHRHWRGDDDASSVEATT